MGINDREVITFVFEKKFNCILFNLFFMCACILQRAGRGQRMGWLLGVSTLLPPGRFLGLNVVPGFVVVHLYLLSHLAGLGNFSYFFF